MVNFIAKHSSWLAGMDDEDLTEEKNPNYALKFHVIVIDSGMQTRSPYNRITEIRGERSTTDRSHVVKCRRTRTKGGKGRS